MTRDEIADYLCAYAAEHDPDGEAPTILRAAAAMLCPPASTDTVEVRIHVRVDVQVDEFEITEVEYYAVGWGDNGVHAPDAKVACEGPTDTARYSIVTARVPKPAPVAEVAGTVEP